MGNPGRMLIRSGSDGKDLMTEKKDCQYSSNGKKKLSEDLSRSYLLAQRPISALQKSVTKLASRCLNLGSIKHHYKKYKS